MRSKRRPIGGLSRVGVLCLALSGCVPKAGPVDYQIPPGISTSFSPTQLQASKVYSQTFCSVLAEGAFSGDNWQACNRYVEMPSALPPQPLAAIPTDWTLLLVGGRGAECFAPLGLSAFKDAADHLTTAHGLTAVPIPVAGFGTTDTNAQAIRDFVAPRTEPKFIAVTHSKGAADVMTALSKFPSDMSRVQALITVAGAVGGSFVADKLAPLMEDAADLINSSCVPAAALGPTGFDSMTRKARQDYLAATEHTWRAYAITAVATDATISRALKPLWQRLLPYALENDSHLVEREAIVPGGRFLGRALGDHLAVGFPFSTLPASHPLHGPFNRNRFPRPALLEAALRDVIADLLANP